MIVGQKTRLRPVERHGLSGIVRWFGDRKVRRHLEACLPFSLTREEHWYEDLPARIQSRQEVVLAVGTRERVHIGNARLQAINWKDRNAEPGIVIGEKGYRNRGYGSDAIGTMLRLAFGEMSLHRAFLRVDADNVRAIRCYEKCGFRQEGRLRDQGFREGR